MSAEHAPSRPLVVNRYVLYETLGEGGMGVVYRAQDRLTGRIVALKRIRLSAEVKRAPLAEAQTSSSSDQLLRLALEFRTMVGLRHPHIINVYSYGFDLSPSGQREPYFTMELIEGARTLLDYAEGRDAQTKIRVLIEILEALEYLHRRGIVHRDLKPANVLVDGRGEVKVMDFGLALGRSETYLNLQNDVAGTLAYMAPEVLSEEQASVASDLYAVGVMAYEVLVGRHPFGMRPLHLMIGDILQTTPDTTMMDADLAAVLDTLLAKRADQRYASAGDALRALCQATGQPLPPENALTRESFLKAARFVGRKAELGQLREALKAVLDDAGDFWLVGGARGAGKSRLIEELRARAMVEGATVIRGWAVEGGGLPYQLWQNPIRRLALFTEIPDAEAAALGAIVPELGALLERDIPASPDPISTAPEAITRVIVGLFRRQARPIVLLLDDLQWAGASLDVLKALVKASAADKLPLLIVGCYRDDEAPRLDVLFPSARRLHIGPLDEEAIAELSEAMLGEAGRDPDVLALLKRESGGNVFLLIETVRALAEEAGRLSDIGKGTLPERVFSEGVQSIIERRMRLLPLDDMPMLRVAAVVGRQIDLKIMRQIDDETDYDAWFVRCVDAGILMVGDMQAWEFVHDNYREGILGGLSDDERPRLHRLVAGAIETAYPDDAAYAGVLADHWRRAGEPDKAEAAQARAGSMLASAG
jgi:hypothetical protein